MINSLWTRHLPSQEEKERFVTYIRNSKGVLDRLLEIIELDEEELNRKETTELTYDSPSWAALQADRNGYRRYLRKIKQLINLDQKE